MFQSYSFVQSLRRSHLTKLTTPSGVVVSMLVVFLKIECFYNDLYASHASLLDPKNEDSRAKLTCYHTKNLPEVSPDEIKIALGQLKNWNVPGVHGVTTKLLKTGGKLVLSKL